MLAFPQIEFILEIGTWDIALEGWIDTAFEGGITIPKGIAREIIRQPSHKRYRLADESEIRAETWPGQIDLLGHRYHCEVAAIGSQVLIGLEVISQLDLRLIRGRRVQVTFPDGGLFEQEYP